MWRCSPPPICKLQNIPDPVSPCKIKLIINTFICDQGEFRHNMQTKALILVLILALLFIPVVHGEDANDWYTYGQNALTVGNYTLALTDFNNALSVSANFASAMSGEAVALNGLGNYTGAIPWAEEALTYRPSDPIALNARAFALYKLGRYNDSVAAYNTLLAVQNNNKDAYCNQGYAYTFMNQSDNAISSFKQCLVLDPPTSKSGTRWALPI